VTDPAIARPLPAPGDQAPSVTVVVPVRNGAATLDAQLRLLEAESLSVPWTIVVADHGSTDGTEAVSAAAARRSPRVQRVDAADRPGPAHARNVGAGAATGALLCFCDADDEIEPGWLGYLVDAAAGHHFVAGRLDIDTINTEATRRSRPRPRPAFDTAPPFAPSGNLAIWADVLDAVGGFDETLRADEDVELSERLLAAGARMAWARDAVVHYRLRESGWAVLRQSHRAAWFATLRRDDTTGALAEAARRAGWLLVRLPDRRTRWLHQLGVLTGALGAEIHRAVRTIARRWRARSDHPTRGARP
jgi:glycosyltransferase involved in cell wall biosynthesis